MSHTTATRTPGSRSTTPVQPMALRPTSFEVASESKSGVSYRVQLPDCSCPDFKYRRANKPEDPFCKHLKEAFRVAGWQRVGESSPIVIVIG